MNSDSQSPGAALLFSGFSDLLLRCSAKLVDQVLTYLHPPQIYSAALHNKDVYKIQ